MPRLWRPSNSTDGEMWMGRYCEVCTNDISHECEILLSLMLGYDEHVTAEDGETFGVCSKFDEIL